MPTFSPSPGQFFAAQTVTITDSTPSSTIFYTLDGSSPSSLSTQYTAPVLVPANATLRAFAIAPNFLNSSVASGTYGAPGQTSTTVLTASAGSVDVNQPVTLSAAVSGASPSGTVQFLANGTGIGSAQLSNGSATYQATFKSAATYAITAQYAGDANNTSSTSGAASIVVGEPDFVPGPAPPSQTVSPGGTATYRIEFTGAYGYSGIVHIACSGLPNGTSCLFNPAELNFSPSGSQTTVLNINTSSPAVAKGAPGSRITPGQPLRTPLLWCGVVGLLLGIGRIRRLGARLLHIGCLLLAATVIGAAGCADIHRDLADVHGKIGTPPGTYAIDIIATDAADGLRHNVMVTLTVR